MSDVETTVVETGKKTPVYTRVYVTLVDLTLDGLAEFVDEARRRGADGTVQVRWANGILGGGVGLYVKVPPLLHVKVPSSVGDSDD